jgi:hypothetical protein
VELKSTPPTQDSKPKPAVIMAEPKVTACIPSPKPVTPVKKPECNFEVVVKKLNDEDVKPVKMQSKPGSPHHSKITQQSPDKLIAKSPYHQNAAKSLN